MNKSKKYSPKQVELERYLIFIVFFIFIYFYNNDALSNEDILDYKIKILRDRMGGVAKLIVGFREKVFAGVMIAIGWIVTSKEARSYLNKNKLVRYIILFAIVIFFVIIVLTFYDWYRISNSLFMQLSQIENNFDSISNLEITTSIFRLDHFLFTSLFFLIFFILLAALVYIQKSDLNHDNSNK